MKAYIWTLLLAFGLPLATQAQKDCTQIACQVSVCATDPTDAANVASNGLQFIMGQDCAGWSSGPTNAGQGTCASGLSLYTGEFTIWRAWVNNAKYQSSFAGWGNFLGGTCSATQNVYCTGKSGPNAINGQCI